MNPFNWLLRWKPAPGAVRGSVSAGDALAAISGAAIAFAAAWPTIEVALRSVLPALPDTARPTASLLISTAAAAVAFATQLYRMWHQGGPPPPPPPDRGAS